MTKVHPIGEKWPVSGPFMATTDPWTPDRPHLGVDFYAPDLAGKPVKAPADGVIVTFANDGSFGAKSVCLNVGDADPMFRYHLFAHLSARTVDVGDHVTAGMTIGFVGGWGLTGPTHYTPHLHWQRCRTNQFTRADGDNADPLAWLAEEEPMTKEERDQLAELAQIVKGHSEILERIDRQGIILGPPTDKGEDVGYDLLSPLRELNADVVALAEKVGHGEVVAKDNAR